MIAIICSFLAVVGGLLSQITAVAIVPILSLAGFITAKRVSFAIPIVLGITVGLLIPTQIKTRFVTKEVYAKIKNKHEEMFSKNENLKENIQLVNNLISNLRVKIEYENQKQAVFHSGRIPVYYFETEIQLASYGVEDSFNFTYTTDETTFDSISANQRITAVELSSHSLKNFIILKNKYIR